MTVKELFEYVKEFKEEFKAFESNDFHDLEGKVDSLNCRVGKLSVKIAWIVGIISGAGIAVNILLRVL